MGAPKPLANGFQVGWGRPSEHGHRSAEEFHFEEPRGATMIVKGAIGVCGMITPWNWPINQVTVKVFPALATGCTVVLKPSQESHFSACILAEIIRCGAPACRRVQSDPGQGLGRRRGDVQPSRHRHDLDHRLDAAGIEVAKNAAPR
jgi:aldehyde dehydrogenase (NAD+)